MVYGSKQASKQASIHMHVWNAVMLVWGLLRLAPDIEISVHWTELDYWTVIFGTKNHFMSSK